MLRDVAIDSQTDRYRENARNELTDNAPHIRVFLQFTIALVAVAGIINTEGALWKNQRKFLRNKLINLGMTTNGSGKKDMGKKIMVSIEFGLISVWINNLLIYRM